jgi:hypothetical protein
MHELLLIKLYYYVCEEYNGYLRWNVQRFSSNQHEGQISDEEIITIYLFCVAYEEKYKVKRNAAQSMHKHIVKYWKSWFPTLPSYQTFNDRLNRVATVFPLLVERIIESHGQFPKEMDILIGDSLPIMTCSHKRAGKVAPELTSKGFCAVKKLHYFGSKLHLRLQVPYWAKNYIAPCKSLTISNLQGEIFRLPFYISTPLFYQYQSVSCCYSVV